MVGRKVSRMWELAKKHGADPKLEDFLMLAYDPSPWKSEFHISVTKEVPGIENVRLSGIFYTRVFDGPFSSIPKWAGEMEEYAGKKGKKVKRQYFYYPLCPKCAKKIGHHYIVAFAQIE